MLPFVSPGGIIRTAGFFVAWAAGWPLRAGEFASKPHPVANYSEAIAGVENNWRYEDRQVAPRGRTILLTRGQRAHTVYVLLHGLTASPAQFAVLADSLFATGANVYVPRLPRHSERNGDVRALKRLSAEELRRFGDTVTDISSGLGDTIVVAGISAGGTVAAWMGQHRREVHRVIMIAPTIQPYVLEGKRQTVLIRLTARAPNIVRQSAPDTARPDRNPGYTTHALVEMFQLGASVRQAANRHAPAAGEFLMLLNENDRSVSWNAAVDLAQTWEKYGARSAVYAFPRALHYPHNVWDPADASVDPVLVFAVVMSLTRIEQPGQPVRIVLTNFARSESRKQE